MTVARILAAKGRDVITTQPHRTLAEVAEVLVAKNIGAVVVTDVQGRVIGILSERDIVRAVAKRGIAVFNDSVSMHMTAEVITTNEDEHVHELMDKPVDGFAISPSSAMNNSLAWCQLVTWSSTDLPSANMNTRRCENISQLLEPLDAMAWPN